MQKLQKVCFILNIGPHYRKLIFKLLGEHLNIEFFIGDRVRMPIATMDYATISGFQSRLRNIYFGNWYYQRGIFKSFRKKYEIFMLTGDAYGLSNWLVLFYCRIFNKKAILWSHGMYGKDKGIKKSIKLLFFKMADEILLYGNSAKLLMESMGISGDKMHVVYNSLDYDKQIKLRNYKQDFTHTLNTDYPSIIYVGRIQEGKRLDLLVDALSNMDSQVNLLLVGKEMDNGKLRNLALDKLNEDQVYFYGPCYEEEIIASMFNFADLSVTPGYIGLFAIHSMMYGTPVLTHNDFLSQNPEYECVIPGLTGDFFDLNSQAELIALIQKWINKVKENPEQVRQNCYKVIDNTYNPHHQIEIINRVLNQNN